MKEYPKILGSEKAPINETCIAFDKLDGSNLRFEWDHKQKWYKFGTRRRLFDAKDPDFGGAIELFMQKYSQDIEKIVFDKFKKPESFICYAEYFGPNSFAGIHDPTLLNLPNDPKDLVLFDVNIHKKGFVDPQNFVNLFGNLHIPRVLYQGPLTLTFIDDVRQGKYDVVEGVIVKGGTGHDIWMRKIKTLTYLQKLKDVFGVGWVDYAE